MDGVIGVIVGLIYSANPMADLSKLEAMGFNLKAAVHSKDEDGEDVIDFLKAGAKAEFEDDQIQQIEEGGTTVESVKKVYLLLHRSILKA